MDAANSTPLRRLARPFCKHTHFVDGIVPAQDWVSPAQSLRCIWKLLVTQTGTSRHFMEFQTYPQLPDARQSLCQPNVDRTITSTRTKNMFKNSKGSCFREKGRMARRDEEPPVPSGPVTEEQRSERTLSSKTLWATGLLPVAGVGSANGVWALL